MPSLLDCHSSVVKNEAENGIGYVQRWGVVYVVGTRLLGAWGVYKGGLPWGHWACVGFGCMWRCSRVGALSGQDEESQNTLRGLDAWGWCTLGDEVWGQGALG